MSAGLVASKSSCAGSGTLVVRRVAGQSAVVSVSSRNPLKILTPRSRGTSAWAIASSFGGGLVSGDQTRLEVMVESGARCYLGTQASTKVFRNPRRDPCGHQTMARVGPGALLVFAPDPVQPFADSIYVQRQEFQLAADASLVLLDWFSAGRTARGEVWRFHQFRSRNAVRIAAANGRAATDGISPLAFLDSLALDADGGALTSAHRTGRYQCFATLLCLGPAMANIASAALESVKTRPVERDGALLMTASPVRDGVVVRWAGREVEAVGAAVRTQLSAVSPLLGDDPWARKW